MELPLKIVQDTEDYIKKNSLSKSQQDQLWERVRKVYKNSLYDSEEPVGVVAAQSLSEPATQMTMRTYHFAGTAGIQVTLGLPRLLEIFDARKEPKTPTMTVFLDKAHQTEEKARRIAEEIKEVKVKDIVVSDIINLTEMELRCKLNLQETKRLNIDLKGMEAKIKLRNVNIQVDGSDLIATYKKPDIKDIFKLKYRLFETYMAGIKGVTQTVINRDGDEWIINTLGSNLKKVLKIEGVDTERTTSNNIFEVQEVFGVEAARNSIIKQAMYTIEEQGLGIDIRYLMLLADLMTADGEIKAVGRYVIAGQKSSVLARAAFEETRKHITKAAVRGEVDYFKGVIENIMVNQVIPVGTGSYDLVAKFPNKPKSKSE
ncbi:MAG: DNA-directed RNA polymerase subunit A'' [Candidatus Aenigmarchaeota archaeon]|nr:DNA-directed RNA polymerase subunit A'' [Candidatus Aenigmarchaeota archaeon]